MARGNSYLECHDRVQKWARDSAFGQAMHKLRSMVDISMPCMFAISSVFDNNHTMRFNIVAGDDPTSDVPDKAEVLIVDLNPIAVQRYCDEMNGKC